MADEEFGDVPKFHWADYLVLGLFLAFSALLGVFIGWRDRRHRSSKAFLMGGGDMHYIPTALSMQASFLSAIFILTTPTEIYNFGTLYFYLVIAYFTALPVSAHMYLPIFHKLKLTSAYEYLERRFNKPVRIAGSLTFVVMVVLYIAVVLYTPAIALAQVTGLSVTLAITVCGIVCVFYTVMGGMKATIWNDFIQMIVICIGLVTLIVCGVVKVDANIWDINVNGSRIQFDNFDPDPTVRTTFWTQVVGGTFVNVVLYASSQTIIQKFLSIKNLRNAQKSLYVASVTSTIFLTLVVIVGCIMYAYYEHCDPIMAGRIEKADQMVPLFVMDVMGDLHGLPGLFLAATFSAALSSVSGSLNALAAVFLYDFIKPLYKRCKRVELAERTSAIVSRLLALGFGIFTIVMGFAAQYFGDLVLQIALSIFGFVGGPLLALVSLGIFLPFVNSWGALAGIISSLGITSWIAIGAIVEQIPVDILPRQDEGCPVANISTTTSISTPTILAPPESSEADSVLWVYKVSHMYYGIIAMAVAVIVSVVVSVFTCVSRDTDERLTYRWYKYCCCYCPQPCQDCLRCGSVPHNDDDDLNSSATSSHSDDSKSDHVITIGVDNAVAVGDDDVIKMAERAGASVGTFSYDPIKYNGLPPPDYEDIVF